jgi:hypothetical protein
VARGVAAWLAGRRVDLLGGMCGSLGDDWLAGNGFSAVAARHSSSPAD